MKDHVQTEEAPRIEIGSQTTNDLKIAGQKRGFRVLHVDDDPCILQVSKEILELEGNFEVDTAVSVDEAVKKLEEQSYDAVISDYEMPQKNGLDFLKELRQQKNEIPFILFTGKGREEVAITALNLGADGYYNKQGSTETVYGELAHGIRLAAERMNAKSALEESEKRYRTLMEQAAEAIFVHDINGQVIDVNQQACLSLGYTKKELLSMGIADIDAEATETKKDGLFWPKVVAGQSVTFESTQKRKDGSTFPVEITLGPSTLGKETVVIGLVRDITERKKAEENLEKSEKEKSAVLNSMSELVIYQDLKHRILWVNKKAADSVNMKVEQLKGRYCHKLWAERVNPCTACPIEETVKKGQPQQGEMTTPDGRVWSISGYPIKDANGNVTSAVEVTTEITEKKKAEEALKASEAKYRELLNGMNETAWVIDFDANFIDVNDAAVKTLGYSREELLSMGPQDIDNSLSKEQIRDLVTRMPADQVQVFETAHTTKDGKKIPVEISSSLITYQGKQAILSIARDITERKKMMNALSESEEKYRRQFEEALDAIFVADAETGILVDCNPAACELVGRAKSEIVGMHQRILHPPEKNQGEFSRTFKEHLGKKKGHTLETQVITKSGEIKDVTIKANIFTLGNKTLLQGSFRDITERKKIEKALLASEEKYRATFESTGTAAAIIEEDTTLSLVNAECEKLSGYSKEELEGKKSWTEFVVKEDLDRMKEKHRLRRIDEKAAPMQYEFRFIDRYGEIKNILLTIVMIPGTKKSVASLLDITERIRTEENLRQSEEKYHGLFESTQDGIIISDAQGVVVSANQAAAIMLGYKNAEELVNAPAVTLYADPQDRRVLFELLAKKGTVKDYEVKLKRKDGTTFDARATVALKRDLQGKVLRTEVILRDITERKKAKLALQEGELKFRTIADFAHDWVYWLAPDGGFVYMSPSCEKITGYTAEEFIKDPQLFHRIISPQDAELVGPHFDLFSQKTAHIVEFRIKNRSGETRWISHVCEPVFDHNGKWLGRRAANRDITERKQVEEEKSRLLHDFHERAKELNCLYGMSRLFEKSGIPLDDALQETADLLPPAMQYPDITCARIVVENREFSTKNFKETQWKLQADIKIHGKKVGSVEVCYLEERPTIAEGPFLKEERQLIDAIAERLGKTTERKKAEVALKEERNKLESVTVAIGAGLVIISKDYHVLWANDFIKRYKGDTIGKLCYATLNSLDAPCPDCGVAKIFAGKTTLDSHEYCSTTIDGNPYWVEIVATPITDENGNVTSAVEIAVDITEKKEAEKKLGESSRRIEWMNEKLRVIGGLTRHDVRNKLSAVTGYAYLLKKKHGDQADIVDSLDKMEQAVKDSMRIFDFARVYEQLGAEELFYVDVERTVNEAVSLFSGLNLKLVNDCHGLSLLADSFLRQLFFNFVDNTIKYGKKATAMRVHFEKAESDELRLIYEDDGIGISAKDKLKLFTEGFSTGGSTGFGLFLSKKMMDVYGWTIQETGEAGKGAKFVITIPKVNQRGKENFQIT